MVAKIYGSLMKLDDNGKVVMCLDDYTYPYKRTGHNEFTGVSGLYTPSQLRYYMRAGIIRWC